MPQNPYWLQCDAPRLPQNSHFPFDDLHPHLIHPSLDQSHSPSKWHPHPISRFSTIHPPDRPTDGLGDTLSQVVQPKQVLGVPTPA